MVLPRLWIGAEKTRPEEPKELKARRAKRVKRVLQAAVDQRRCGCGATQRERPRSQENKCLGGAQSVTRQLLIGAAAVVD